MTMINKDYKTELLKAKIRKTKLESKKIKIDTRKKRADLIIKGRNFVQQQEDRTKKLLKEEQDKKLKILKIGLSRSPEKLILDQSKNYNRISSRIGNTLRATISMPSSRPVSRRHAPPLTKPLKENQISPNTLAMLQRLRSIQNKGKQDNLRMQRIIRERKLLSDAGNLLKTPSLFGPESNTFDIFDDKGCDPLKAPNIFAEKPDSINVLRKRKFNLLNTKEAGNNLKFF